MNIKCFLWFTMDNFFCREIFREAIDFMEIRLKLKQVIELISDPYIISLERRRREKKKI